MIATARQRRTKPAWLRSGANALAEEDESRSQSVNANADQETAETAKAAERRGCGIRRCRTRSTKAARLVARSCREAESAGR